MIKSRDDLAFYLYADLVANGHERFRAHYRVTQRIAYFQRLLRMTEYYENCSRTAVGRAWGQFLRLRLYLVGERLGFTIPRNVFGPGLSIAHKGTIVVNQDARVGRNCRIHQGVTIGGNDREAPVIGDRVMISAGACILQNATVGDLAVIGANSVVNKAVPSGVTVGGIPAKKISDRDASDHVADWCALAQATPLTRRRRGGRVPSASRTAALRKCASAMRRRAPSVGGG